MPRVEKLLLAAADYDRIVAHAKEGLPNEACGLIAGTVAGEDEAAVGTVEHVYLLTNIDESNEHFSMDPREQLAAVKDARAHGWEMLGNWHSHPESPSRPSEEDKRLAFDSTAAYLICRSWTLSIWCSTPSMLNTTSRLPACRSRLLRQRRDRRFDRDVGCGWRGDAA